MPIEEPLSEGDGIDSVLEVVVARQRLVARTALNNSSVTTPSTVVGAGQTGTVMFSTDMDEADLDNPTLGRSLTIEEAVDVPGEPDANLTWTVAAGFAGGFGGTWVSKRADGNRNHGIGLNLAECAGKRLRAVISSPGALDVGCFLET